MYDNATSVGEILHKLNGHGIEVYDYEAVTHELEQYFGIDLDSTLGYSDDLDEQHAREIGGSLD